MRIRVLELASFCQNGNRPAQNPPTLRKLAYRIDDEIGFVLAKLHAELPIHTCCANSDVPLER
jgi:hypothetical protein